VATELRTSLRIKAFNTGFKSAGCGKNNYFGCELDPPTLSTKVIKNLAEKFYKMDPKVFIDSSLTSSHTSNKAI
jgi:hypothetical protein